MLPIYATLADVMERTGPGSVVRPSRRPPDPSVTSWSFHGFHISVPSPARRPRLPACASPTCCRPPTAPPTTCCRGRYDHLLPAGGVPTDDRWFTRLHGDDELDVWLISWVPDRSTELHDHGGSLGALTVVSGALDETRWDGDALRRRRLDAGDQAAFPLGWVHDVVWAPTRSLHRRRADAERARVFAAADGDVVLRGDRAEHAAPQPDRTHRQPGGIGI